MDPMDVAGVFYTMTETQFTSAEGVEGRCAVKVRGPVNTSGWQSG
jgi:hypothetical protein